MANVVAALIWDRDKFMICQRPKEKKRGLLWEFVGGKVEPGETKEAALIRECREELNVDIQVDDIYIELTHAYPDITIHLTLFNARIINGTPQKIEHNDIAWITPDDIPNFQFCPADEDILKLIKLEAQLKNLQDENYKTFQSNLIPTKDATKILGVRMPILRKIAKNVQSEFPQFLTYLPHRFHEEDLIHAVIISNISDFSETIDALCAFLSHVDNWAVCDTLIPKSFRSLPTDLLRSAENWIASDHTYTVRFGISIFMRYYLDSAFSPAHMNYITGIHSGDYYVNMMRAWYFATALDKQYDHAVSVLQQCALDKWTHNKSIQKAVESHRISIEQKAYLKTLRIK